eukprot:Platyproteum_vivax@DN5255_c0_g1_i1.p1
MGKLRVTIVNGCNLDPKDLDGKSDPFIKVYYKNVMVYKTKVQSATLNPVWNETFVVEFDDLTMPIRFDVWDDDMIGRSDYMGRVDVSFLHLADGETDEVFQQLEYGGGQVGFTLEMLEGGLQTINEEGDAVQNRALWSATANQNFNQMWNGFANYMPDQNRRVKPFCGVMMAPIVHQPAPTPTGRKKALLIGINYIGSKATLRGCINDVTNMREVIMKHYDFRGSTDSMVCLTDDVKEPLYQPTRHNITQAMQWLVAGAQPGDILFFHFSGHGSQQRDTTGHEADGMSETLVPVDYMTKGQIIDDVLYSSLVSPLPNGCRLIAFMDCCHSGTSLDLPFTFKLVDNRWHTVPNPNFSMADVQLFSGCDDNQTSADTTSHLAYQKYSGAMSTAVHAVLMNQPYGHTYPALLHAIRKNISGRGLKQVPQLSSSQKFDLNSTFDATGTIIPNRNRTLGRTRPKDITARSLPGGSGGAKMDPLVEMLFGDAPVIP